MTTLVRLNVAMLFELLCTPVCTRGSRDVPTFAVEIFDLATACGGALRRASPLAPTPGPGMHANDAQPRMPHFYSASRIPDDSGLAFGRVLDG